MSRARPAAFLDRDGVINVDRGFVGKPHDFTLIKGAAEAISLLNRADYRVFVVTNQSGIGRGYFSEEDFFRVTEYMLSLLEERGAFIDDFRHCPFHPDATVNKYRRQHPWRKPAPGMIVDLLRNWEINVEESFLIGDSVRDLEAANAAGIEGFLFRGNNLLEFLKSVRPELDCG